MSKWNSKGKSFSGGKRGRNDHEAFEANDSDATEGKAIALRADDAWNRRGSTLEPATRDATVERYESLMNAASTLRNTLVVVSDATKKRAYGDRPTPSLSVGQMFTVNVPLVDPASFWSGVSESDVGVFANTLGEAVVRGLELRDNCFPQNFGDIAFKTWENGDIVKWTCPCRKVHEAMGLPGKIRGHTVASSGMDYAKRILPSSVHNGRISGMEVMVIEERTEQKMSFHVTVKGVVSSQGLRYLARKEDGEYVDLTSYHVYPWVDPTSSGDFVQGLLRSLKLIFKGDLQRHAPEGLLEGTGGIQVNTRTLPRTQNYVFKNEKHGVLPPADGDVVLFSHYGGGEGPSAKEQKVQRWGS